MMLNVVSLSSLLLRSLLYPCFYYCPPLYVIWLSKQKRTQLNVCVCVNVKDTIVLHVCICVCASVCV